MEWMPALKFGWLNGWLLLAVEFAIQGGLLLVFPPDVVARLFDRRGWSRSQKVFTILGKFYSLVCLVLIVLTPLNAVGGLFVAGLILFGLGLAGLAVSMFNFKAAPPGVPATRGLYRVSRHPQIVSLTVLFLGICLAIGSWAALAALAASRLLQHFGILGEEAVCREKYGPAYADYLKRVPRYLLFF